MVKRKGGPRAGSRRVFKKHFRKKGKISLSRYFAQFKEGEKAVLNAEPAIQNGIYHAKFHGLIGTIIGQSGESYKIKIRDGRKEKTLYVHPVHLKKVA
ncbi:50S ribosomal protein L21e [Candidatus Woesearchaeota archaeon]|nr:MAG: 50S ribosomal protein L21e [Candidatus Woesearchaeota archaeon]